MMSSALKYPAPSSQLFKAGMILIMVLSTSIITPAQSVSEIITDYNGYYKTSAAAVNPVKPDHNHNLLSFSFNGTRYSTGVNDVLLTAQGETFTAARFKALPMTNITGAPNANTKIGLGAMADGVYNGAGSAPSRDLAQYLTDGIHGLNLGTVVANLPSGTMFLSVSNLQAAHIGDGIPDILVTQAADPSGSFDRYAFSDVNGNVVGNSMDVNLTNITPVGEWVADFYEATGAAVLKPGYTQTPRHIRLWAADFSVFGVNASNIRNIAYFKIDLSGSSDVGFVAYNTTTVTVQQVLAAPSQFGRSQLTMNPREEIKAFKAFPNPAFSEVNFVHPKSTGKGKILVYSFNGVLVLQQPVNVNSTQTNLNITSLDRGSYLVVYTNGTDKQSQQLVVQ